MFGNWFGKTETEENSLLSAMKTVFDFMDETRLPWVLKNLKELNLSEVCQLMAHAHFQIQSTPSFATQAKWYGMILGCRNSCVQSAMIGAMIETHGIVVNRCKQIADDKYLVESDYIVNNYSVTFSYYIDDTNKAMPAALIFWTFFSLGVFDNVLSPSKLWKELVKEYGLDKIKEGMEHGRSFEKIFSVIVKHGYTNLTKAEFDELIAMLTINAAIYGWLDKLKEETKTFYGKVIYLH